MQDVCAAYPGMPNTDHARLGTLSNPAYLLAVDALGNAGPADETPPTPLSQAQCEDPTMPGFDLDPAGNQQDADAAVAYSQQTQQNAAKVLAEPALACYTLASCGVNPDPPGQPGPTGNAPGGPTGTATDVPTGKRAAALKKCKGKKGKARGKCTRKAKKLPV